MNPRLHLLLLLTATTYCSAQVKSLGQNISYMGEVNMTASSNSDVAPFWFTNNRYGLSSSKGNSGYFRTAILRDLSADSTRNWHIGYGADIVVPVNHTSGFFIQQLYAQVEYKVFLLTLGSKELSMPFNNRELSSGDMVIGCNARPIPQVRLEMPDYWNIPGTHKWLGIKGHAAFGWYTDNNWQEETTQGKKLYSNNSLFHSKSLFFRIGCEDRFPLTYEGGLQIATQFGGEVWNVSQRADDTNPDFSSHVKMDNGLSSYFNALFVGGGDPNDGNYKNVEGNHVGSWYGSLTYHHSGWSVRGYFEHLFEDHSQLFLQYGWKDMTWGLEAHLPKNPVASTIVMELMSTKDQTGGIYHDKTSNLPVQISGKDNYYQNHIYGGWQHWGMSTGNPLIISPIYNSNGSISTQHSRIKAVHVGISGDPSETLHYRILYTYMRSWGNYDAPLTNTKDDQFLLAELTYKSSHFKGWSATAAAGLNHGSIISNSTGLSLTIRKEGLIR
jgi:hypothetical protein